MVSRLYEDAKDAPTLSLAERIPSVHDDDYVAFDSPPIYVPLGPFVSSLVSEPYERSRVVRAVVTLKLHDADHEERLNDFMPEVRHRINTVLSSQLHTEISALGGLDVLAENMLKEVNAVFVGPSGAGVVAGVLFDSFVTQ